MATTTFIPIEVYLQTSYDPDCDYVDGELQERLLGEFDHSSWQNAVAAFFQSHAADWNIRVRPELRVHVSATRFRVPDVTLLDRSLPVEQIITVPPLAVFEIVSPADRVSRMNQKLNDYEQMGIRDIWVIDPAESDNRNLCCRFKSGTLIPETDLYLTGRDKQFSIESIRAILD